MVRLGLASLLVAALVAASPAAALLRGQGADAILDHLSDLTRMQPEVVAHLLSQVEHRWEKTAIADMRHLADATVSMASMKESCGKITKAIVAGSDGDKDRVVTYLKDVCSRSGDDKQLCDVFSTALDGHLTNDAYSNREELDVDGFCTSLYEGSIKQSAKAEADAEDARAKAEAEARAAKAKADKEAAEKAAAAKAKAEAEAAAKHYSQEATKELGLAKSMLTGAKDNFQEAVKRADAVEKDYDTTAGVAETARKAMQLADEKEADAAEKAAKEAEEQAAKLRRRKEETKKAIEHKAEEPKKAKVEEKVEKKVEEKKKAEPAQKKAEEKKPEEKKAAEPAQKKAEQKKAEPVQKKAALIRQKPAQKKVEQKKAEPVQKKAALIRKIHKSTNQQAQKAAVGKRAAPKRQEQKRREAPKQEKQSIKK